MSTRSAALYLRILVAWLIAMQPLLAGYAAAATAAVPLSGVLCSGAQAPGTGGPSGTGADHLRCSLLCPAWLRSYPPAEPDLPRLAETLANAAQRPLFDIALLRSAGLGSQSARAPPL